MVTFADTLSWLKTSSVSKNSKSLKSSGQVIRVSRDENEFHFLGTLELGHIHDQIFLNNDHNQLVNLIHE